MVSETTPRDTTRDRGRPLVVSASTARDALLPPPGRLLALALALNAGGHRVFAVTFVKNDDGTVTKKPAIKGYHGSSPFTPREIKGWPWEKATALGWAIPEGVVVLDIDVKDGKQGEAHLVLLESLHGALPATAEQMTASGGRHLVFSDETGGRYRSQVPLPSGEAADIDICHSTHRYVVVYDETLMDQEAKELPLAWSRLIRSQSLRRRTTVVRDAASRRPADAEIGAAEKILGAPEGERNETLFKVALRQAKSSDWDDDSRAEIERAAAEVGLDASNFGPTIDSAVRHAEAVVTFADRWLACVHSDDLLLGRRCRQTVLAVASVLRGLHIDHGAGFGLSQRDLAERIGVGPRTARRALDLLNGLGFLVSVNENVPGLAASHRLHFPLRANWPSPSVADFEDALVSVPEGLGQIANVPVDTTVFGHDAFIRQAGTTAMPKSCAVVLWQVHRGVGTVRAISEATRLSRDTVRRCAHILESAGLVVYDARTTRSITAVWDDPLEYLDKWATWSDASGNGERLRQRHTDERAAQTRRFAAQGEPRSSS